MANRNPYNHPDYKKMKQQIRIAKIRVGGGIPCRLRLNGCTSTAEVVDHRIPLIKGGAWTADNLQPACAHCNAVKSGGRNPRQRKKNNLRMYSNRG